MASFVGDNRFSGMGTWTHAIAAELRGAGHEVTLWFADNFPRLWRLRTLAKLLFPPVLALRIVREASRFDVVVMHEPSGFWYACLRRSLRNLPPLVLMCHNVESRNLHDLCVAANRGLADVPLATRIKGPLFRLWQSDGAIRRADHVVCLSRPDKQYIVDKLGRADADVTVMINGVGPEDLVEQREYPAEARRVLFVGGWFNVKGIFLLPRLWSRVRQKFPDASLTLVGTHERDDVVLSAFAHDDRGSVTNIALLHDRADMRRQYVSHDICLMPSLSEGSPLSLLEAMAAGMPVVATAVGGISQIVTDGCDGLLFPSMDEQDGARRVCVLMQDAALRRRLGQAARERAGALSWCASARTLLGCIERAVAAGAPRPRTSL